MSASSNQKRLSEYPATFHPGNDSHSLRRGCMYYTLVDEAQSDANLSVAQAVPIGVECSRERRWNADWEDGNHDQRVRQVGAPLARVALHRHVRDEVRDAGHFPTHKPGTTSRKLLAA